MKRRKQFRVGIPRVYFQSQHRPMLSLYACIVTVLAYDRQDAAEVAWKVYGEKWREKFIEHVASVSLRSAPLKGKLGIADYPPVLVWEKEKDGTVHQSAE
jgi:hypothetical protein